MRCIAFNLSGDHITEFLAVFFLTPEIGGHHQQVPVVIMHPFVMEMCAGNLSECFLKQFQRQILVLSPVVFLYCQKQHVIVIQSHIALVFEMAIMMLQQPISRTFSFSFPLFTSLSYASCTNLYAGESYPIP